MKCVIVSHSLMASGNQPVALRSNPNPKAPPVPRRAWGGGGGGGGGGGSLGTRLTSLCTDS